MTGWKQSGGDRHEGIDRQSEIGKHGLKIMQRETGGGRQRQADAVRERYSRSRWRQTDAVRDR